MVAVALITRICVEHGMERETAYTLSDIFIQKMDHLQTVSRLHCNTIESILPSECRNRKGKRLLIYVKEPLSTSLPISMTNQIVEIAKAVSIHRDISPPFLSGNRIQLHSYIMSQLKIQAAQLTLHLICPTLRSCYFSFLAEPFIQCFL